MNLEDLKKLVHDRAYQTLANAHSYSQGRLDQCAEASRAFLESKSFDSTKVCLVAVGSVGRREALDASDMDLIPVLADEASCDAFRGFDLELREHLSHTLGTKVSKGESLTKAIALGELAKAELIGSEEDTSPALTQRILILSEGGGAGGNLPICDVRKALLTAYAGSTRTRGRHVLSLCNDLARYYRTLCIEYKARVDSGKDWCTRNLKLRHSRKFWYFSTALAIARLADMIPIGGEQFREHLLNEFERPPVFRLARAAMPEGSASVAVILECFAWFLSFMSDQARRDALAKVEHEARYAPDLTNPFPGLKANSDTMHREMSALLEVVPGGVKQRVVDYFLL